MTDLTTIIHDCTIIKTDEYNILQNKLKDLEKKIKDLEIRKILVESENSKLNILIQEYIETIRVLNEEKTVLINRLNDLETENKNLLERINVLEKDKNTRDNIILIGQCIYDFKSRLKQRIFTSPERLQEFRSDDLIEILKGKNDDDLLDDEIEMKNKIVQEINDKYKTKSRKNGFQQFHGFLKNIVYDRNNLSHPNIDLNKYPNIKTDFLNYCNNININNESATILTEHIFSGL